MRPTITDMPLTAYAFFLAVVTYVVVYVLYSTPHTI